MQTTLMQYAERHQCNLLRLLWDMKPHSNQEVINVAGKQYNARVLELRRQGYQIVNFYDKDSHCYHFKLLERCERW